MPATRRTYLNDNIRTEHLKCPRCRTQAYLYKIEPINGGGEVRTFACPHCHARRQLRLAASPQPPTVVPPAVCDHVTC